MDFFLTDVAHRQKYVPIPVEPDILASIDFNSSDSYPSTTLQPPISLFFFCHDHLQTTFHNVQLRNYKAPRRVMTPNLND